MTTRKDKRSLQRQLKQVQKDLERKRQGMDFAFDMAVNDGGASLKRLEAEIATLEQQAHDLNVALNELERPDGDTTMTTTTTRTLPQDWTVEDIQFLLDKLDAGCRILVAGDELGLPTIHDEGLRSAAHLGFGVFKVETHDYTILFDAGGAMHSTPSGEKWSSLSIKKGEYPYDFDAVRATLQGYLNGSNGSNGAGVDEQAEPEAELEPKVEPEAEVEVELEAEVKVEPEAEAKTHTLTFGDNGEQVYFQGDKYKLANLYQELDGQRYTVVGWAWLQCSSNPAEAVPDWCFVPHPKGGEYVCLGSLSLKEALAEVRQFLPDVSFELAGAPDDLADSYPLLSTRDEHQAETEPELEVEAEDEPGPAGYVAGKGDAYDYVPEWMDVPALYSTEKQAAPLAVIKLFTPDSSWTWYITEYDGEELAFGLVVGFETELGNFSLLEIRDARGPAPTRLRIERDLWFKPTPVTELAEYRAKWGERGGPYKDQAAFSKQLTGEPAAAFLSDVAAVVPEMSGVGPETKPDDVPPAWTLTRRQYQESKAKTAAGVPILNAADGREHQRLVREAVERGEDVPDRVLADYPDLVKTHHRHPHDAGKTLCDRPIGDDTRVSHDGDEVDCGECLCYARRGHDVHGKEAKVTPTASSAETREIQEPWQMTRQEFRRVNAQRLTEKRGAQIVNHRQAVEQALADGKPVPTPVLADYPDLDAAHSNKEYRPDEKDRVEASSVEDFLDRYYKPERFRGRGEEYAASLLASYSADFERLGYTWISRHDSVTGRVLALFGPVETGQAPRQTEVAEPAEPETLSRDEAQANADAASPVCDNALRNAFAAHRGGLCGGLGHPPMCDSNKVVRVVTVYKDGDGDGETLSLCDECYQWSRKNARACGYRFKSKKLAVAHAEQAPRQQPQVVETPQPASSDPAPGPPAAASDDWTPATGDQAEFERWDLELLTGGTGKKSGVFHRALTQVARPGTLRLALLQVNGDRRRQELIEKRLAALVKQQPEPEAIGAANG